MVDTAVVIRRKRRPPCCRSILLCVTLVIIITWSRPDAKKVGTTSAFTTTTISQNSHGSTKKKIHSSCRTTLSPRRSISHQQQCPMTILSLSTTSTTTSSSNGDLILIPPATTSEPTTTTTTACLILVPGCWIPPAQYEPLARAIQTQLLSSSLSSSSSSSATPDQCRLYIGISHPVPANVANPHTIGASVAATFRAVQHVGYRGRSAFVAGHSLGGACLPYLFDRLDDDGGPEKIDGLIHIGCIVARSRTDCPWVQSVPHLVCTGELDGLVRSSRLAEDYYRNVVLKQPRQMKRNNPTTNNNDDDDNGKDDFDPLRHVVISVPGMNHFGIVKKPPDRRGDGNNGSSSSSTAVATLPIPVSIMDELRDLPAELSYTESIERVAAIVADFIACHHHHHRVPAAQSTTAAARTRLLVQMNDTVQYLQPIINALQLEGSYHLSTPCHLSAKNDDVAGTTTNDPCTKGSPWVSMVQKELLLPPEIVDMVGTVTDEFHESWWINPLADPPFYHPTIQTTTTTVRRDRHIEQRPDDDEHNETKTSSTMVLDLTTMSEAVYEKPDFYLFDAGFFSNAALELRSKLHSRQSLLQAASLGRGGSSSIPKFESERGIGRRINQYTIDWALAAAPEQVRRRYLERGTRLVAGPDTEHSNGPSWIWTYLTFRRVNDTTVSVDSHIMSTSLDHPFPFSQGKLYCKLLSPAKALDWIYTDSLRKSSRTGGINHLASRLYNEELLSPAKFFNRIQQGANAMPFFPLVVLNQLVARAGQVRPRPNRRGGPRPPP